MKQSKARLFISVSVMLLPMMAAGCQAATTAASASSATAAVSGVLDEPYKLYQLASTTPEFKAQVVALSGVSFRSLGTAAGKAFSNNEVSIGSFHFSKLANMAQSFSSSYTAVSQSYGTLENYWRSLGIDYRSTISISDLSNGLGVYQKANQAFLAGSKLTLSTSELGDAAKAEIAVMAILASGKAALALDDDTTEDFPPLPDDSGAPTSYNVGDSNAGNTASSEGDVTTVSGSGGLCALNDSCTGP